MIPMTPASRAFLGLERTHLDAAVGFVRECPSPHALDSAIRTIIALRGDPAKEIQRLARYAHNDPALAGVGDAVARLAAVGLCAILRCEQAAGRAEL